MNSLYSNKPNYFSYSSKFNALPVSSFASSFMSFDAMNVIIEPTDELGGLYLGNYEAASDVSLLRRNKISAVLTVAAGTGLHYNSESISNHELIPAMDVDYYDMTKHFDRCFDFIDKCRKSTSVLVHCWAGVSRSATIIIAYLMKKYEFNFDESLNFVKKKRKQIYPNPGFIRQLRNFESQLRVKKTKTVEIKNKEKPLSNSLTLDKPLRSSSLAAGLKTFTPDKIKKNVKINTGPGTKTSTFFSSGINSQNQKTYDISNLSVKNKTKEFTYGSYYPEKNYVYDRYAYLKNYK